MKRNLLILFSLFICCSKGVTAVPMGETHTLTLEEAIMLARVQSVDAAVALNELKRLIGNIVLSVQSYCRK